MTTLVPDKVTLGPSAQLLRRSRPIAICFTALAFVFMFAGRDWIPLVMIPVASLPWLHDLRMRRARMELTHDTIEVRALLRWTRFPASRVTEIVLGSRPGVAIVVTEDGGSAVVTMSANGVESDSERRVRLHETDMLARMYRDTSVRVVGAESQRKFGVNRSSASVEWKWSRITWHETLVIVVTFAWGLVSYFV